MAMNDVRWLPLANVSYRFCNPFVGKEKVVKLKTAGFMSEIGCKTEFVMFTIHWNGNALSDGLSIGTKYVKCCLFCF